MDETVITVLGILCTIALPICVALILGYQARKSRHAERMAMIEKGIILEEPEKKANRYPALRNGLFMVFLALGIIVGIYLEPGMPQDSRWADLNIPILAILFGGIGFILYFFLSRIIQENENRKDREMNR